MEKKFLSTKKVSLNYHDNQLDSSRPSGSFWSPNHNVLDSKEYVPPGINYKFLNFSDKSTLVDKLKKLAQDRYRIEFKTGLEMVHSFPNCCDNRFKVFSKTQFEFSTFTHTANEAVCIACEKACGITPQIKKPARPNWFKYEYCSNNNKDARDASFDCVTDDDTF